MESMPIWLDTVLKILLGVFGGGSFVIFLINRHDAKKGELKELKEEVKSIRNNMEEDRATTARVRILRFSDEMRRGEKHTKEMFDQTLQDIDRYKNYCDTHPNYENERAKAAIQHVKAVYQRCLDTNDFLM